MRKPGSVKTVDEGKPSFLSSRRMKHSMDIFS